jgi:hypothetical protein
VALPVAPSSVTAQPSSARCGAKRGEGRGGKARQRSATVAQSRSLRFLNFGSSRMGRLRHSTFMVFSGRKGELNIFMSGCIVLASVKFLSAFYSQSPRNVICK